MAEEKGKAEGNEADLAIDGGNKKKKMIIIIIAVMVLLAGGGGAYFFFMGGDSGSTVAQVNSGEGEPSDDSSKGAQDESAKVGTALYVPMPRPFRFNIPGSARDRFVEIRVQLLVRGGDNEENAKMNIPLIESTLLTIFSQTNADDLATSVGKDVLKQQSLTAVQMVMKDLEGNETVEKVLFTGFVMQ